MPLKTGADTKETKRTARRNQSRHLRGDASDTAGSSVGDSTSVHLQQHAGFAVNSDNGSSSSSSDPTHNDYKDDGSLDETMSKTIREHEEFVRRISAEMDLHIQDFHQSHYSLSMSETDTDEESDDDFDMQAIPPPSFMPEEWKSNRRGSGGEKNAHGGNAYSREVFEQALRSFALDEPMPEYHDHYSDNSGNDDSSWSTGSTATTITPGDSPSSSVLLWTDEEHAALKIQTTTRTFLARCHYHQAKVIVVQSQQRFPQNQLGPKGTDGVLVVTATCYVPRHVKAVVELQSWFRGYQQRRALRLFRTVQRGRVLANKFRSKRKQQQRRFGSGGTNSSGDLSALGMDRDVSVVGDGNNLRISHWSSGLAPN